MDENRTETAFRSGADFSFSDTPVNGAEPGFPDPMAFAAFSQTAAQPNDTAKSNELPTVVLTVAGLTVFDAVIIVVFLSLWGVNPEAMLAIIKTLAGIALLLGVAPIVMGGLILHTNKQTGTLMPGTPWAGIGILVGMLLSALTLLIPLLSALRLLLGSPTDPV